MRPFLLLFPLLFTSCAYVGDPLPPALKIPTPVTDLAARQVGADLIISFTIPATTLENLPLTGLSAIDLRLGPNPSQPFNADSWAASATPLNPPLQGPGSLSFKTPASPWVGREVILGVRLANRKGRFSPWSNFLTLNIVAPLAAPINLRAEATASGVALDWEPVANRPNLTWKLFRQSAGEEAPTEMATLQEPKFLDTGAEFGRAHTYTLLATEGAAISPLSQPLTITPLDKFPPAVPQGLSAIASSDAINLTWERNTDPDFASYTLYRATANGPFTAIAAKLTTSYYRDATATPGQTWRYALTALDHNGNESAQSQPVEIPFP
jgi:hypothetical protein